MAWLFPKKDFTAVQTDLRYFTLPR